MCSDVILFHKSPQVSSAAHLVEPSFSLGPCHVPFRLVCLLFGKVGYGEKATAEVAFHLQPEEDSGRFKKQKLAM